MDPRYTLLMVQLYIHALFVVGVVMLPMSITIPTIVLAQAVFVGLCGTVFYHRVVTHKNPIHPLIEKVLLFLSWIGASGSAIGWAATHRMHHKYSDTPKDPHSPKYLGRLKTYWWSSATKRSVKFVPDLLRKPLFVWSHQNYFLGLLLYHAVVLLLCPLTVYWMLCIVPGFLMWFAGSMTNVFGHDEHGPVNNSFMGYLFAGEGWHKNHHDRGSSPQFNDSGDWGYLIYKLIKR